MSRRDSLALTLASVGVFGYWLSLVVVTTGLDTIDIWARAFGVFSISMSFAGLLFGLVPSVLLDDKGGNHTQARAIENPSRRVCFTLLLGSIFLCTPIAHFSYALSSHSRPLGATTFVLLMGLGSFSFGNPLLLVFTYYPTHIAIAFFSAANSGQLMIWAQAASSRCEEKTLGLLSFCGTAFFLSVLTIGQPPLQAFIFVLSAGAPLLFMSSLFLLKAIVGDRKTVFAAPRQPCDDPV